jgi:hypothetical protein
MNEPVRVGLVFPRSGQQLFVNVPRHFAAAQPSIVTEHPSQAAARLLRGTENPTDVRDLRPRTQ